MSLFIGLGMLVLCSVLAYLLYQIARLYKEIADDHCGTGEIERAVTRKIALKKGIDLKKEEAEQTAYKQKSFRNRLQQEAIKEFFDKK